MTPSFKHSTCLYRHTKSVSSFRERARWLQFAIKTHTHTHAMFWSCHPSFLLSSRPSGVFFWGQVQHWKRRQRSIEQMRICYTNSHSANPRFEPLAKSNEVSIRRGWFPSPTTHVSSVCSPIRALDVHGRRTYRELVIERSVIKHSSNLKRIFGKTNTL